MISLHSTRNSPCCRRTYTLRKVSSFKFIVFCHKIYKVEEVLNNKKANGEETQNLSEEFRRICLMEFIGAEG